jgi:20S proteasome subunit beta 6
MAVAGDDYCIVAGDTRMSEGYSILSRSVSKLSQLNGTSVLASAGMQADACQLRKVLAIRLEEYKHKHGKEMGVNSIAQLLSNTLYFKRFFPYYTFNLLAGLDGEGKGAVYGYDAIGSFERMKYGVNGSGMTLIMPLLDNQVAFKTHQKNAHPLSIEEAIDLVKDCFTVAGERDIYTGDQVEIVIMTKEGTKIEMFQLKKD